MRDIIVVGAGPSGVSAALYAKARGKDVLVLEKDHVGGLISHVSKVSHFASVAADETGESFGKKLEEQLNYSHIDVVFEEVIALKKDGDHFVVTTNNNTYEAKKVIYAAGSQLKELGVENLTTYHWPFGNEEQVKGKLVIINGGSDGASKEGLYLAQFAREVHMVQDQDKLLSIDEFKKQIEAAPNIVVHTGETIVEKISDTEVKLASGKTIKDDQPLMIFVQIGQTGNAPEIEGIDVENGFVNSEVESAVEGLYFAGDIRVKPVKQVSTAVADGTLAGIKAAQSL